MFPAYQRAPSTDPFPPAPTPRDVFPSLLQGWERRGEERVEGAEEGVGVLAQELLPFKEAASSTKVQDGSEERRRPHTRPESGHNQEQPSGAASEEAGGTTGRAAGASAGAQKTVVYTTISPNVLFLTYQVRMWRKMCADDVRIIGMLMRAHAACMHAPPSLSTHAQPRPCLHPARYTLYPIPYTLHPTPYTPRPTPYALRPTPHTLMTPKH